jgi:serine/threonine protein kinase
MKIKSYWHLEKIGGGGSGSVYKAIQASTGQLGAFKILRVSEGIDSQKKREQLVLFDREIELCVAVHHPNIVQLIDKGYFENGEPYAVFEYIEGETLRTFLLRKNFLTICEMVSLMKQVLSALICVHNKEIVHRDLKPQNSMISDLGDEYHAKVLDFGIGTFMADFRNKSCQRLTIGQDVLGTPAYSAPEQLRGS